MVFILVLSNLFADFAQEKILISGNITDSVGKPVSAASIVVVGTYYGVNTDDQGKFEFLTPFGNEIHISISCLSYKTLNFTIKPTVGQKYVINKTLEKDITELENVTVTGRANMSGNVEEIDMKKIQPIPTTGSGIESLLKTLPGVTSNNEFSSQYNVRGGSFDENVIYVNDVEIYRPLLIKSGQQEGLSFINSDMVGSLKFSAGGFDAIYGDKMSSVLDITYRQPTQFAGSASGSILGGNLSLEGINKNKKLTWLIGARYKTNQYLLNSLNAQGEYKPVFVDFQSSVCYKLNDQWDLSFLGSISDNKYLFIPTVTQTTFGSIANVYQLNIYYNGQELDQFNTSLGAFTLQYIPLKNLYLKFILSAFTSAESETYDLNGQYWINDLGDALSQDNDNITAIGVGSFLEHARNQLNADVFSISHKGLLEMQNHKLKWGLSWQKEIIHDRLDQWTMIDSAGYSIPYDSSLKQINFYQSAFATNTVLNDRIQAYCQDINKFQLGLTNIQWTYGLRFHYSHYTNEFLIIPRSSISLKPNWNKDILFYFSTGYYPQMPFYREMRNPQGELNNKLRSQKSWHFVLGGDYNFMAFDRPFKFTTEAYYKYLWDLVPYKVQDVSVQYAAENLAKGYAMGVDFKVNGEFIKGTESWFSMSLMHTEEINNQSPNIGYYPRPANQLLHFGMFVQDYLPNNPTYTASLLFVFGTGFPVSNPIIGQYVPYRDLASNRYNQLPAYKRVDLGLSKVIKREDRKFSKYNPICYFREIWITAEILNVFNIENTVSYMWLRSVGYQSVQSGWFAVPNYLTPRLFNLKLTMKF